MRRGNGEVGWGAGDWICGGEIEETLEIIR